MILTVFSVIARYMPWVRNAVGISGIRKRELKTAQTVCFRISEKNYGYVTGKYQELADMMKRAKESISK